MDDPTPARIPGAVIALVIVALLMACAWYLATHAETNAPLRAAVPLATSASVVSPSPTNTVSVTVADDDPVIGDIAAPVTVILFSDFECPYCRQFHQTTFQELKKNYIDTDRVRVVFKDFPLAQMHPQATLAAEAAQCAHQQEKFWPYIDLMFAEGAGLAQADLQSHAERTSLNPLQFETCLTSHERAAKVTQNVQEGLTAGITGTPSFVIDGQLIEGAMSYTELARIIDSVPK